MLHERVGGNVVVDGIGVPELSGPCVIDGVDDDGATATFGGLVQLEIIQQQFVDDII